MADIQLFSVLRYEFTEVTNVVIPYNTMTPVASVIMASVEAGTYELGFSVNSSRGELTDVYSVRSSSDGGVTWVIHERTPHSTPPTTNSDSWSFPVTAAENETLTFEIEMIDQNSGGATALKGYIWIKRVN